MVSPGVAVVVLNWNRWETTVECIESLQELEYENRHLVVVDNGSTDGSVAELSGRYPRVRILEAGANLGFSGGVNVALEWLRSREPDYVWLLNNDTEPEAGALAALVALAESDAELGAVGSVLVDHSGSDRVQVWGGGRVSFWSGLPRHHRRPVAQADVDYLMGASLLLRWQALSELGFLDEHYFLYWEDTDLCFRLRAAGWKLGVAEGAVVSHRGYGSMEFRSPTWDREFTASSVVFFRRHASLPWPPIVISAGGRMLRRALSGEWGNAAATWQGVRRGLCASSSPGRSTP
jgi:GT2 family glycosyltransferase